MKKREESFSLTVGSSYLIRSVETRDKPLETSGIFRGFASLAQETGLAIELDENHGEDKGRIRIVPLPVILSVDILKEEKKEAEEEEKADAIYFS